LLAWGKRKLPFFKEIHLEVSPPLGAYCHPLFPQAFASTGQTEPEPSKSVCPEK
jgi:hypothetical protein